MDILQLKLFTSNLNAQRQFYSETLGLTLTSTSETHFSLSIGLTTLTFEENTNSTPYHFAINIPSNKLNEALNWLKKRINVLSYEGVEIHRFEDWNANAIYFYDADKNIVEFIGRHNLKDESADAFSPSLLRRVSEIGVAVDDLKVIYETIKQNLDLPIYDGSLERFCAIGDENGLFICLNKTVKKTWFPTQDIPRASDFKISVRHSNKSCTFAFENATIRAIKSLPDT